MPKVSSWALNYTQRQIFVANIYSKSNNLQQCFNSCSKHLTFIKNKTVSQKHILNVSDGAMKSKEQATVNHMHS